MALTFKAFTKLWKSWVNAFCTRQANFSCKNNTEFYYVQKKVCEGVHQIFANVKRVCVTLKSQHYNMLPRVVTGQTRTCETGTPVVTSQEKWECCSSVC